MDKIEWGVPKNEWRTIAELEEMLACQLRYFDPEDEESRDINLRCIQQTRDRIAALQRPKLRMIEPDDGEATS